MIKYNYKKKYHKSKTDENTNEINVLFGEKNSKADTKLLLVYKKEKN